MPTVTEARLLSWGRGEASLLSCVTKPWAPGRCHTSPPREASGGEASYLELGRLKDAVGIEHDGIDPRQLLEGHEGNADDEGLVDARAPQQGQLEALSQRRPVSVQTLR